MAAETPHQKAATEKALSDRENAASGGAPSLATWSECAAEIVRCVGDPEALAQSILDTLGALGPRIVSFVTASLPRPSLPLRIWVYPADLQIPKSYYAPEVALLDPFFVAARQGRFGLLELWDVAPPGFPESEVFREHFARFNEADEFVHSTHCGRLIMSAGLGKTELFADEEREAHLAAHPLITSALSRLAELLEPELGEEEDEPSASHAGDGEIEAALQHFARDELSDRERQVVQLILRGHNTESVAHQLDISWHTVRRHRRGAYDKLRVNSQGELFYAFLRSLGLH